MLDPSVPDRLVERGDKLCYDALGYIDEMYQTQAALTGALQWQERELTAARERIKELTTKLNQTRGPHHGHLAQVSVVYGGSLLAPRQAG